MENGLDSLALIREIRDSGLKLPSKIYVLIHEGADGKRHSRYCLTTGLRHELRVSIFEFFKGIDEILCSDCSGDYYMLGVIKNEARVYTLMHLFKEAKLLIDSKKSTLTPEKKSFEKNILFLNAASDITSSFEESEYEQAGLPPEVRSIEDLYGFTVKHLVATQREAVRKYLLKTLHEKDPLNLQTGALWAAAESVGEVDKLTELLDTIAKAKEGTYFLVDATAANFSRESRVALTREYAKAYGSTENYWQLPWELKASIENPNGCFQPNVTCVELESKLEKESLLTFELLHLQALNSSDERLIDPRSYDLQEIMHEVLRSVKAL